MPATSERRRSPQPSSEASDPGAAPAADAAPSPARSDRSSDSEGKPVRDKLKETRIDAHAASDHTMPDASNRADTTTAGENNSTSGSESSRGRLRRKRSREDFEDEPEKQSSKKVERHVRTKSGDHLTVDKTEKAPPLKSSVPRINEHDGDDDMSTEHVPVQAKSSASTGPATPEAGAPGNEETPLVSPPNKRTHDQAKSGESVGETVESAANAQATSKTEGEREPKRHRDESADSTAGVAEPKNKIPATSGFANFSASSPFSALGSKPKPSAATEKPTQNLPQTSDAKFKASGFGGFAASSASPFGGNSAFAGPAGGNKITSFASSTSGSTAPSGFGALGSAGNKSAFGAGASGSATGSGFGGSSGFGGFGGAKSALSSFATPGASTIVGLTNKPARAFGAAGSEDSADEEDDDDEDENGEASVNEDGEKAEKAHKSKATDQPKRLHLTAPETIETGEEGEDMAWTGRAKLYKLENKGSARGWHERGAGPLKLNLTKTGSRKARFILRADGTQRLILNAAITKGLMIGDTDGLKPKDGKLIFGVPTADGTIEPHLLKMKDERAAELWDVIEIVKDELD